MTLQSSVRETDPISAAPDTPLPPLPSHWRSLGRAFIHQARARWAGEAVLDSTGAKLTFGDTLIRALALGRALSRILGPEPFVGVLVPPSAPGAVTNIALTLRGKIPVNLNFTAGQAVIDSCIDQCGIRRVITSRKVLSKLQLNPKGELILLEDVAKSVSALDKAWAAVVARLVPMGVLGRFVDGLRAEDPEATATVIFTSGSTGDPKGVVLTQKNILSNVHQIDQHVDILPDEVVLGMLPFFHSFGFTVGIWTPLCLGKKVVYHPNPLDARIIGDLCETHKVTLLAGTPTFARGYVQRCRPEQFATVVHMLLGAEKLKPELAKDIRDKLKIEPLEGYGCTELSPVVAVNVRRDMTTRDGRTVFGSKSGTVGRLLPGTAVKTVDPDTGEDLPRGTVGLVHVAGPQVMAGYLNRPEATEKVLKDGWYSTGDLGKLDDDGFLTITDRLSRFSKIGGEMVPHVGVESAIMKLAGVDESVLAVTSLPDPKRGERLLVLHTGLGLTPEDICRRLADGVLPRLWVPDPGDFHQIESIPILGTGKVDLRGVRERAREFQGS